MKIENFKMGDVVDVHIKNNQTKRVMIINKNEDDNLIFGLNQNNEIVSINPECEVKKILFNIYEFE